MSTKSINVLGYTGNNSQFVVKTLNTDLKINQNESHAGQLPNPFEYILAGFAGCINALGQLIAAEQNIILDSLQVEIIGDLNTDKYEGKPTENRAGFNKIEITLKPTTSTPLAQLMQWLKEIQARSPVYDNLVNSTPVDLILYKEYSHA
jgi:uncharacterized OsmC-like protein